MPELNDLVSIRRLPDGGPQIARIANWVPGGLALASAGDGPGWAFDAGAPVEIDGPEAVYLGEVIGCQDSLVTIAVEHFVDRAALVEIEKVWKTSESA